MNPRIQVEMISASTELMPLFEVQCSEVNAAAAAQPAALPAAQPAAQSLSVPGGGKMRFWIA